MQAKSLAGGGLSAAYFITRPDFGGAQAHVLALLRAGQGRREQHLATGSEGPLTEAARAMGVLTHILPTLDNPLHPLRDAQATRDAYRLIRRLRPAIVHAHSSKAGLVARLAARLAGVPAIFTAHGWAFTEGTPRGRRAIALLGELLAARCSSRIICVSRYDRELALRYRVGRPGQLVTIHNGVADVAPALLAAPGCGMPVRLVMVARLSPQKDAACLIRAAGALSGNWEILFVGNGELLPSAARLAAEMGLEGRVLFLGARRDVPEILAASHVFVLASRYEGLPISIIEAMRAGLPVVASSVGGVPELVTDGENGFLVPRGDIGAMAEALQRLIDDPGLRERMGQRSRERYLAEFTLERMVRETERVYEEVLAECSPA
jgi:glycosyltransferase involved in cell wall biosynthesis